MFIFFDGEEAFQTWGPKDSIYGARHLAEKWHNTTKSNEYGLESSELDKMVCCIIKLSRKDFETCLVFSFQDMLILLDLIGARNPKFYNYFEETKKWFNMLVAIESELNFHSLLTSHPRYFQRYPFPYPVQIEDDHIPFMRRSMYLMY